MDIRTDIFPHYRSIINYVVNTTSFSFTEMLCQGNIFLGTIIFFFACMPWLSDAK